MSMMEFVNAKFATLRKKKEAAAAAANNNNTHNNNNNNTNSFSSNTFSSFGSASSSSSGSGDSLPQKKDKEKDKKVQQTHKKTISIDFESQKVMHDSGSERVRERVGRVEETCQRLICFPSSIVFRAINSSH